MTTGSSSPRSPEYAISAVDLPTGETTTATGTHPVRPPGTRPDAAPAAHASVARSPAPEEPAHREPDFAPHEPVPQPPPRYPAREEAVDPFEESFTEDTFAEDFFADDDRLPPEPFDQDPAAHDGAVREYGDPVGDLVRAAVADRPLEEVVDLITMLEGSPQYAQATIDALRAVGVNRSVEDVTRLVGLLTRPPRNSDSADEAIRAAAECRSVEDVTRLMELLHRTPLEPHCGQEAVRAAATGRPVEELVQLIGRLAEDGRVRPDRPDARHLRAALDGNGEDEAPEQAARPAGLAGVFAAGDRRGREGRRTARPARRGRGREEAHASRERDHEGKRAQRDRTARRSARGPAWPVWITVAVLAGCGVAYFPLHQNDASARAYGVALGLSALCLLLALLLTVRPAVPLLAAAVVAPAALAAAKLYGSVTPSSRVSRAVDLTLAPTWIAVAVAVLASLVALTALCVRVASQAPARRWSAGPMPRASRVAD
ncbi:MULTISPECIES: hypothetical protein [unclassified Streptomyces]|uniref:hypothetical protein n=1 Tax=Streptomyces TaxID=1883 RepID=UPI0025B534FF|nr:MULTISPECIES: hypothetical protein [unclassified Streptomyces]MDN3244198.1 hypothetical protein [Streptomyces sp. ZSW22]MDN3255730.1 hypothetical protein [Streptomyces sp. MA25(2023)]